MRTYVIVLHYGDLRTTNKCLKSIVKYEKEIKEIIVVDNDHQKNIKYPISNFKCPISKLKIIRNKKNLGYAAGVNVGIKYALSKGANYVLVLNNDTYLESGFITKLIKKMNKAKIGVAAPAIKFIRDGKIVYDLGGKVNMFFGRTSHHEVTEIQKQVRDDILQVDYVSGCCMLIKKEVFEKVGFFDERFFMYYEDVDFCIRARKKSFKIVVFPSHNIFHELSKTIGKSSAFSIFNQTRSALIFGKKHLGVKYVFNTLFIFLQSLYFFIKNPSQGRHAFLGLLKA